MLPHQTVQPRERRLLVIDDDQELCRLVAEYLEPEGLDLSSVHRGIEGVRTALSSPFDLVILDVMLPDKKGFDVLREIRAESKVPVLMLTAKGDEFDRVFGLELGADDYLPKPFSPRELVARISALLRRSNWLTHTEIPKRPPVLRSGELTLDLAARSVTKGEAPIRLTSAEFDLLQTFMETPGKVLSREQLVERVLDRRFSPFDRSIDLHISNLRRKLGPAMDGTDRIRSVRGIGYMYAWPNEEAP